ncbi:uncharacterized protein LOC142764763 [Rhipicephalus microplus]|uniref:uncharacterized protein LOC142764763 n=1 Tax=Rhipicephalus microplus TaxID=6941 RepID=UPI003F6B72E8
MDRVLSVAIAFILLSGKTVCNISEVSEATWTASSEYTTECSTESQGTVDASENLYSQLWNANLALLVSNSNHDFNKCLWYVREGINTSHVSLQKRVYLPNQERWTNDRIIVWKYGANNSMSWTAEDGTHRKTLIYKDPNNTCGVSKYEYFMESTSGMRDDFVKQCNNSKAEHCRNGDPCKLKADSSNGTGITNSTDDDEYTFVCLDTIMYELLVDDAHKEHVPENCTHYFIQAIKGGKNNTNENVTECIKPDLKNTTPVVDTNHYSSTFRQ